jgi:DNA-binding SARP family transcriptional activator
MDFRILGPLEVTDEGGLLELGPPRPRALLALLLLSAPGGVSVEALIDGIWGDRPPASARHLVQVYISQLRARLGDGSCLQTRPPGYALSLAGHSIDVAAFEDRVLAARRAREEGRATEALLEYESALACWRGAVVDGATLSGGRPSRAAQLEAARLVAEEERLETALALGRDRELVPELERLVAAEPLRERFWAALMLALHRSGRQAEALSAYQSARRQLAELGLEPSNELKTLERRILQQDPELLPRQAPIPARPPPHRDKRRVWALLGICALVGAAVAISLLTLGGATRSVPKVVPHNSLGEIDAASGVIMGSVHVGNFSGPVSASSSRVWVGNNANRTLLEIDSRTRRILGTFGLGIVPYGLQETPTAVWVANSFDGTISRVDGVTGLVSRPQQPEPASAGRIALAYGAGSLWSVSQDGLLVRLNPSSGHLLARIGHAFGPQALTVGFGSIWIAQAARPAVVRATESGRTARSIPIGGKAFSIATGAGAVWALSPDPAKLWRINPRTDSVTSAIDVGADPAAVVVAGGSVWVASATSGTLLRIDPRQNKVIQRIRLAGPLGGLAAAGTTVWISVR